MRGLVARKAIVSTPGRFAGRRSTSKEPLGRTVVAYWTLRFYADHPEARPELADARAVDRVARRDLQAPPAPGG